MSLPIRFKKKSLLALLLVDFYHGYYQNCTKKSYLPTITEVDMTSLVMATKVIRDIILNDCLRTVKKYSLHLIDLV